MNSARMRLAVISDIHGNLTALEAVLADYEAVGGADHLWVLGDLAAFGARPVECIQRIKALYDAAAASEDEAVRNALRVIRGNNDRYFVTGARPPVKPAEDGESLTALVTNVRGRDLGLNWGAAQLGFEEYAFLRKLSGECELGIPGFGGVIGYHGTPGDDEGLLTPTMSDEEAADALLDREGRLAIGGHIHRQMDRQLGGWRAINVGSVGMSFDQPGKAQWGLFTFEDGRVTVDLRNIPYDYEAAIADLAAVGYPALDWIAPKLRPA